MKHSIKGIIYIAFLAICFLFPIAYANNQPILRAETWYLSTDKQQLDVVVSLPGSIPPLVKENFKLRINDQDVTQADSFVNFQQSGRDFSWLICIQSTSALSEPFIKSTQEALFLLANKQNLKMDLLVFGVDTDKSRVFENTQSLAAAIKGLKPLKKRNTKLYQSLIYAIDFYKDAADKEYDFPKRKRMLVIADGHDEESIGSYKNVITQAADLGIAIDTISIRPLPKVTGNVMSLEVLAKETGGYFSSATAETDLANAINNVYKIITETQTVVASFKYKSLVNQPAKSAEIVLQLPSAEQRYFLNNPQSIPLAEIKSTDQGFPIQPPPVSQLNTFILTAILITLMVGIGIIWFVRDKVLTMLLMIKAMLFNKRDIPTGEPPIDRRKTFVSKQSPAKIGGNGFLLTGNGIVAQVNKSIFNIGSGAGNDLVMTNDSFISSKHAAIHYTNGSYYISDRNSRNGTFVNNIRIQGSDYELSFGDKIKLGQSVLEVKPI